LIATTISLARISLRNPSALADRKLLSPGQLLIRFLLLPWCVAAVGGWLWPAHGTDISSSLIAVVLLLAAPTAVTATILSRSAGGMILPSVYIILLSTVISAVNTTALLAWFGMSDLAFQALVFVGLSVSTLLFPMAVAYYMRRYHPIVTAKFAEDYAAAAVLALAMFVVLAFQNIHLDTFYPMGILAIVVGVGLRLLAVRTARHRSLYGLDDYFSTSYPNIFLVILLANLVGNAVALDLATWFLVPMFMLTPLDDRLILRLQKAQPDFHLLKYLRIHHSPEETRDARKRQPEELRKTGS
jgi:predicted Na+-dependent transporter